MKQQFLQEYLTELRTFQDATPNEDEDSERCSSKAGSSPILALGFLLSSPSSISFFTFSSLGRISLISQVPTYMDAQPKDGFSSYSHPQRKGDGNESFGSFSKAVCIRNIYPCTAIRMNTFFV